ncbi:MAG TPA: hypothetical protein DCS05_01710 [Nitrospiraceae bacterium]|nr:hypothetical protein [Nitrospiraceae bacterium]
MDVQIGKIPGGLSVDGLELKNGKCGCTTVLPCCHTWSKVKRSGNAFSFVAKITDLETRDNFEWGYTVKKGDLIIEVKVEDARDKVRFSGYYPPRLEAWIEKGWDVVSKTGEREDFDVWRCAACKWLYKEQKEKSRFEDLPDDWKCPVCNAGKDVFERIA